ncbi:MAG: L-aspartate oxidase [Chloroflexi bacterium RBG_13_56_8]|nr:MAG: L-aspartate oxidase [Chloroflexi bacterium RBG_13_56_8]
MSDLSERMECDVLIIGCGIAGATAALRLSEDENCRITVITKARDPLECNTYYAQGGIIYRGEDDSPEKLVLDLIRAGDGMNKLEAVEILANEGPKWVRNLLIDTYHVPFTTDDHNQLEFTREAVHSTSRILHVDDATGKAIQEKLAAALASRPNIQLLTGQTAVDLLTPAHHSLDRLAIYEPLSCVGAYVFDQTQNYVRTILAKATILASGGIGQVFLHTTNPEGATGDGLAMAYRAGARIINSEYVQFHPTTFYYRDRARFLISEALRGEGARLLNIEGEPFMHRYAPDLGDLAPRDVVARGIHLEMLRTDAPYVYLDIASKMSAETIEDRFPTICANCREYGVDPTGDLIPVVPAAHYLCGGVWVDRWGRTSLRRLYAVGEVSCTGVHGANRLGSASLLEGLVWGARAAKNIEGSLPDWKLVDAQAIPPWRVEGITESVDPALIEHDMATIEHTMWYYVGLVRSRRRLERAFRDLNNLRTDLESFYRASPLDTEIIKLRNACQAALIIQQAAWENRESRGCHYRED